MLNDRVLHITVGANRKSVKWLQEEIMWSELCEKLHSPTRSTEPLQEYVQLPKSKQDDLKDIGGFVGGTLDGDRRKATAVQGRDIVTLDLDSINAGATDDVVRRVDALGCGYCVYSTRKHCDAAPRLRVLLPLNRTCTADEYEPIARKLAEFIGMEMCDPSTFEASRLMYWPSCSADSRYVYTFNDRPFIDADGVLDMYTDCRNVYKGVKMIMDTYIVVAVAIIGGIAGVITIWQLIRAGYVNEVKGVLLYFVTQAEQLFGGKTGKLKRAAVLAWIYERMPAALRLFISADAIGWLIDEAVEEMKKYLSTNSAAAAIVSGEVADDE